MKCFFAVGSLCAKTCKVVKFIPVTGKREFFFGRADFDGNIPDGECFAQMSGSR